MTTTTASQPGTDDQSKSGFFINAGTHTGWFTTPDGDVYDIRKLEPREVTDPRSGEVTTIWGGYATARDRDLAAHDAMLQAEFKKTGERPTELFVAASRDIPLYITLRNRPGKTNEKTGKPSYTDIGSFWNSRGRYTVLARDLAGKSGLRFGGNVLAYKPAAPAGLDDKHDADMAAAERAQAFDLTPSGYADRTPDGTAARQNATKRAGKQRDKSPTPEA